MKVKIMIRVGITIHLLLIMGIVTSTGETRQRAERPVRESIDTRQRTQKEEDQWRRERAKWIARFERLQQEQRQLESQKAEVLPQVESARARTAAKEKQLADIGQISHQIRPYLDEIIHELKRLTAQGSRFLTDERRQRIQKLEGLVLDTDIPMSEKYRKVMEALLVEAEYGFTVETYQETITVEGQTMLADVFRLGRISLFFQTLDRKHCGFYNVAQDDWQTLPPIHSRQVQTAIDIAAKRRPVELLSLPVGRMVTR